jgi:HAD superfamily hydrolase (TIGR01509 family)
MQVVIFDFFGVVFDPRHNDVMLGLDDFLHRVYEQGWQCGIASSTTTAEIEQFLREHTLQDFFGVVVGADRVAQTKPDPECYLAVAEHFQVVPADCLVIDDSVPALAQARAVGFQTIYFGAELDNFEKIATLIGL